MYALEHRSLPTIWPVEIISSGQFGDFGVNNDNNSLDNSLEETAGIMNIYIRGGKI